MAVHYLYGQFSQLFQPTSLSPRQERLCMQSLVGLVIGVDQGWQFFEVATPFGTGLYDSKAVLCCQHHSCAWQGLYFDE